MAAELCWRCRCAGLCCVLVIASVCARAPRCYLPLWLRPCKIEDVRAGARAHARPHVALDSYLLMVMQS